MVNKVFLIIGVIIWCIVALTMLYTDTTDDED